MSHQALSADTEVVLLLCGRFGGESQESFQPLAPGEYGKLAFWLNSCGLRPADLLSEAGLSQLQTLRESKLEASRIEFLLARGTAMALALERWSRGGLWVISRGDPEYPARLKRHLKHSAPPILYGAGEKGLLDKGGLAIIGSRDASAEALEFTREIAGKCAREGMAVVSGGARGVDSAAMQCATEAGGYSIGVLACDLLKSSLNKQNRIGLQDGELVLLSPYYPEASFNAGNAMGRNKYIYALSNQALVIDTALASGGTWAGAIENLKQSWVPLYVRSPGEGAGNSALIEKGGIPFLRVPDNAETLDEFFQQNAAVNVPATEVTAIKEYLLPEIAADAEPEPVGTPATELVENTPAMVEIEPEPVVQPENSVPEVSAQDSNPSDPAGLIGGQSQSADLFEFFMLQVRLILADDSFNDEELSLKLGLEKAQSKAWLKKGIETGQICKLKGKPVRYGLERQTNFLD